MFFSSFLIDTQVPYNFQCHRLMAQLNHQEWLLVLPDMDLCRQTVKVSFWSERVKCVWNIISRQKKREKQIESQPHNLYRWNVPDKYQQNKGSIYKKEKKEKNWNIQSILHMHIQFYTHTIPTQKKPSLTYPLFNFNI